MTKPLQKEKEFNAGFENTWNASLPILVKSGGIIKNMDAEIGLIITEFLLSSSQLAETVLQSVSGSGGSQGKCVMNILIKRIDDDRTNVFLNTKFIVETYSQFGGKVGEVFLSSNGKIEEDFFEKLSLALGEKKYEWLTGDTDEEIPPDQEKISPAQEQANE
jgi:hypothetical protein